MKATRDHFGAELVRVARANEKIVVVNCDLASATKTSEFKREFPDRFIECGIAEANAIGVAAGLAHEGYRPFVASFAHFLTGKFLEIFQSVGLNQAGVVLVGTHAGLAIGKDGPTQMGLRDLALMRSLHNIEIMQPADGVETCRMLDYLSATCGPAYLRLCRQAAPEVHAPDHEFVFGRPDVVRAGSRLAVFTMGGMVPVVAEAAGRLPTTLAPTVVNVSTLPTDTATVTAVLDRHPAVLVVEDHFVRGGLADEIARIAVARPGITFFDSIGVPDYGQAGDPNDLYERYQLTPAQLAERFEVIAVREAHDA